MKKTKLNFLIARKTKALALIVFATTLFSFSQSNLITKLEPNFSEKAKFLKHELNKTEDTLFLRADRGIEGASVISHDNKKTRYLSVDSQVIKIPMYHFSEGRYTVAVYCTEGIIAIAFNRIKFIVKPEGAEDDLQMSVLRASLSKEELLKRNVRPRIANAPKAERQKYISPPKRVKKEKLEDVVATNTDEVIPIIEKPKNVRVEKPAIDSKKKEVKPKVTKLPKPIKEKKVKPKKNKKEKVVKVKQPKAKKVKEKPAPKAKKVKPKKVKKIKEKKQKINKEKVVKVKEPKIKKVKTKKEPKPIKEAKVKGVKAKKIKPKKVKKAKIKKAKVVKVKQPKTKKVEKEKKEEPKPIKKSKPEPKPKKKTEVKKKTLPKPKAEVKPAISVKEVKKEVKEEEQIAQVTKPKKERKPKQRPTTLQEDREQTYNLSTIKNRGSKVQSRAEYRRNNKRPNGKDYD
ncbi:hypothetical protein [Lacinutrix salivirga]